jgi:hypothetical protein
MSDTATITAASSGKRNTVVVCCKLPHGFILELSDSRIENQNGKDVVVHFPVGEQVEVTGANYAHRLAHPKREQDRNVRGVFGFGMTDVDADLWAAWLKQKATWPPLQKGWVYAQPSSEKARGQAREQEKMKVGFEPLDQDKPAPGVEKASA